jgi:hypothetical protein
LSDMPLEEVKRIRTAARFRNIYRLPFFNTEDRIKLRLRAKRHETKHASLERHCALCGNTRPESNWRGHRYSFSCTLCEVHLRIRLHQGFRKTFWPVWPSVRILDSRVTRRPSVSSASNDEPNTDEETDSRNRRQRRRLEPMNGDETGEE